MPRYYCDYCDTYLTHDSPSVRKQHNSGYKHKANVRTYYQQFEEQQTQSLIDQRIKEHLGQTAAYNQVGAVFNQHMLARPRLPMMPMPMGMRPPILPRPMMPGQGYMPPPGVPQMMAPPGGPLPPPPPQNGILRPPGLAPIPGQGGAPPPNYTGLPPPPPYHTNPAAAAPPSVGFNNPNPGAESPETNE
ncbi:U1 small nuclear ribonucleoprotein C [Raphanus sativus]|uniref:U1 small nuclear ribonucleoprotein C n=1 Tax=Raphanus sativus TaxID=3726 RepID=A0A6J0LDW7_RAPSA|nr:U1 small nuclear ribonucleoprotein C [Raphanus sativus]KAJ4876531.1 U1 small nuclear ribonucleoprotein C [Raphanus sativus]